MRNLLSSFFLPISPPLLSSSSPQDVDLANLNFVTSFSSCVGARYLSLPPLSADVFWAELEHRLLMHHSLFFLPCQRCVKKTSELFSN